MTQKVALGQPLADVEVQATGGKTLRLSDLKGKPLVLYFYPRDQTPGCTAEGQDFRDHHEAFEQASAVILGVSRDRLASHEKFRAAHGFPFELVADVDEKLCRLFGVMKEKQNYGRTCLGVERTTFVFDKGGVLRKEFRGVKVAGHVERVLEEVRRL